jgi:hypothetical protein
MGESEIVGFAFVGFCGMRGVRELCDSFGRRLLSREGDEGLGVVVFFFL